LEAKRLHNLGQEHERRRQQAEALKQWEERLHNDTAEREGERFMSTEAKRQVLQGLQDQLKVLCARKPKATVFFHDGTSEQCRVHDYYHLLGLCMLDHGKEISSVTIDGQPLSREQYAWLLVDVKRAKEALRQEKEARRQRRKAAMQRVLEHIDLTRLGQALAVLCLGAGLFLLCLTPGGFLNKTLPEDCRKYRDLPAYGVISRRLSCEERAYVELGNAGPVAGFVLIGLGALGLVVAYAKKDTEK
jgi:hypothetical protein